MANSRNVFLHYLAENYGVFFKILVFEFEHVEVLFEIQNYHFFPNLNQILCVKGQFNFIPLLYLIMFI